MEQSSPWKERRHGSYLTKIVKMDHDNKAVILQDDPNKSIRYLYLALLMDKKNAGHMHFFLTKLNQIKLSRPDLNFINLPIAVARLLPTSTTALLL